jgi:hypothetical protein
MSVERLDSGTASAAHAPLTQPESNADLQVLKLKVRERLKAIALDDPRRPQKMQRAFLESVLVWQFGAELMLDHGFEDMIAGVQESLSAHPELQAQCQDMLATL